MYEYDRFHHISRLIIVKTDKCAKMFANSFIELAASEKIEVRLSIITNSCSAYFIKQKKIPLLPQNKQYLLFTFIVKIKQIIWKIFDH